eukprot:929869_1
MIQICMKNTNLVDTDPTLEKATMSKQMMQSQTKNELNELEVCQMALLSKDATGKIFADQSWKEHGEKRICERTHKQYNQQIHNIHQLDRANAIVVWNYIQCLFLCWENEYTK